MFTGIITAVAEIEKAELKHGSLFLNLTQPRGWKIKSGQSIATDGVCLTVKKVSTNSYQTELMAETLAKSTFGQVLPAKVNLEQSLRLKDLLGGHLLLGHVDAVGVIEKIKSQGQAKLYQISFPKKFRPFVVEKGAIAVDGISLTIVGVGKNWFTVSAVDYTLQHTTMSGKRKGEFVNLEFDIIAKYLSKIISQRYG